MTPLNFFDPYYISMHVPGLFLIGCLLGSFFNVCIYRMPLGISIAHPPSHCYRCGRPVRWFDNIPLLSYWILQGRCRDCGAPFSMRYFCIELLTGFLVLALGLKLGYTLALIPAITFTGFLVIATFTDIDHWIIPDRITIGGMIAGLILAAIWPVGLAEGNPLSHDTLMMLFLRPGLPNIAIPLTVSVAGAVIGFGMLWLVGVIGTALFRKEAMGMGDMKLMAAFGAFCGVERLVYILLISSLAGTLAGVFSIFRARMARELEPEPAVAGWNGSHNEALALLAERPLSEMERRAAMQALDHPGVVGKQRHHLPFGPSLAVGAYIVFLYGEEIAKWFEKTVGAINIFTP